MPMRCFVERFPELGALETRTAIIPPGEDLPARKYEFLELYCNEPGCDCRRLVIQVFRRETGLTKVWATIGYGWESEEFYRKRLGGPFGATDLKGPFLDPLNEQSVYSPALLDVFRYVLESPDYVERIKRHYQMFRELVAQEHGARMTLEARRAENRKKRLRDPRRRGRRP